MHVGSELYGKTEELYEREGQAIKRKVTHTDTKTGVEYAFQSEALDELLKGEDNLNIDYEVRSNNGRDFMHFKSQRELVTEFLKVLALAHECVPETVTKSDGTKITFYQGPSPDEVTLVDFAKFQGFNFIEGSDIMAKLQLDKN